MVKVWTGCWDMECQLSMSKDAIDPQLLCSPCSEGLWGQSSSVLRVTHNCSLQNCVSPLLFVHPQGISSSGFSYLLCLEVSLKTSCTWGVYCSEMSFFPDKWTTTLRPKDRFQTKEPIGGVPQALLLLAELRCPSSRFTLGTLGWSAWRRASAWGNFWASTSGLRTNEKDSPSGDCGEDAGSWCCAEPFSSLPGVRLRWQSRGAPSSLPLTSESQQSAELPWLRDWHLPEQTFYNWRHNEGTTIRPVGGHTRHIIKSHSLAGWPTRWETIALQRLSHGNDSSEPDVRPLLVWSSAQEEKSPEHLILKASGA